MAKYSFLLFTALLQFYESQIFSYAHPFLTMKVYNHGHLAHFISTSSRSDKRKHSNSQLDTASVKSIELSQLTPTMNLTLNLKLHGKERRKSDMNCDGGSLT